MNIYWTNLVAWSLQVAVVGAVGATLPFVFRLRASRARLWYWHVMLIACLALPLLQPWAKPTLSDSRITFTTGPFRLAATQAPAGIHISWSEAALAILCAGIAFRLLWLGVGLLRLRRFRATAMPLDAVDDHFADLHRAIAPEAEILVSGEVTSPVTFGVWNAVILLPARFRGLGLDERRSIVCHELIHVRRRDWAVAIAEELVRSMIWFHPAVWWLLGQIQLTREQVVDEAVIGHTGDRNRYLDALLAIASLRLTADLAPAPLFLKKRHLRKRVESIVSGVTMTKRNLLFPLAAALATLPVLIGIAAWQFPLRASPQEAVDDAGVEVQLGANKVLHRTGVAFPDDARAKQLSGTVVANVKVDAKGEVTDAQAVSGPDELRKPVVQSILNWHFELDSASDPRAFEIAVRFNGAQALPAAPRKTSKLFPAAAADVPRTIDSIDLGSLPAALRNKVTQSGILHVGDVLTRDSIRSVETSLRNIDDHLQMSGVLDGDKVHLVVGLSSRGAGTGVTVSSTSIRVGGNAQAANLIRQVRPMYPPKAKEARIQGAVKFNVLIGADGTVKDIELITGHPLLAPAAMEAVRQWVYRPTLLNGTPVEVNTVVDVNFTLLQ